MNAADLTDNQRDYIADCGNVCEAALRMADLCDKRGDAQGEAHYLDCAELESRMAFAEVSP